MALLDVQRRQPTPADGAHRARMALRGAVDQCASACEMVRQVLERHTKAAIAAELGEDAAQLKAVYDDLKAVAAKYGREVPEMPE
jgi:hypothetical protein